MINLIVAVGKRGQIGLNGELPWHDKNDLKWFKELTMGHVLVVGFNTYQKLPTLPGRTVHVMQRGETPDDVIGRYLNQDLWIIGGAKTYEQWMSYVQRFYISRVEYDGPADTRMPPISFK